MKHQTHLRTVDRTVQPDDDGIRPAGPDDACYYCGTEIGGQHDEKCPILRRVVVLEATITVALPVTLDATPESIEFHWNNGTRCASNLVDELTRMTSVDDDGATMCLCDATRFRYVREAAVADVGRIGWGVAPTTARESA